MRAVLRWRSIEGREWVHSWLYGQHGPRGFEPGVAQRRGQAAADRLRDDARLQWERGNRGEPGDWR